jgi:hypothetical protein
MNEVTRLAPLEAAKRVPWYRREPASYPCVKPHLGPAQYCSAGRYLKGYRSVTVAVGGEPHTSGL